MTIRRLLILRKRLVLGVYLAGLAAFASIPAYADGDLPAVPTFLVFICVMGAGLYGRFGNPCPRCERSLGALVSRGSPIGLPHGLKVCPFCEVSFDEPANRPPSQRAV